jgi:hypothetical protein
MIPLRNAKIAPSHKAATLFQPMRLEQRDPALPLPLRLSVKAGQTRLPTQYRTRNAQHAFLAHRTQRPAAEQVWLKASASSQPFIENSNNREFQQPVARQAVHTQAVAPISAPHHISTAPQMPDMNRLVEEVISRIERTARNEQLRRGR